MPLIDLYVYFLRLFRLLFNTERETDTQKLSTVIPAPARASFAIRRQNLLPAREVESVTAGMTLNRVRNNDVVVGRTDGRTHGVRRP